jgi:hypothetical protein
MRPGLLRRRLVVAIVVGAGLFGASASGPRATLALTLPIPLGRDCSSSSASLALANDLMQNRYTLAGHPTVTLPSNPTWRENPLHDDNWVFNYQSLRFVWDLIAAWAQTGDRSYLDRGLFLLHDWYLDNPRSAPRSPFSWEAHATAWRAIVYTCAAEMVPATSWLNNALLLHGRTLASSTFYVYHGNHALNQARGLLGIGCFLRRSDWKTLAVSRIATLVTESVDAQGVTNEQAVGYQLYNWRAYSAARQRIVDCSITPPSSLSRISRMPAFLAYATLPDGTYAALGDTGRDEAPAIRGTIAEFAATAGLSGPKPPGRFAFYTAGFAFGRTGWGEQRAFADESAFTLRFGPAQRYHGHDDGTAVTLYGFGRRLVDDSGKFTYNNDAWRRYALSTRAHNVVTVDGLTHGRVSTSVIGRHANASRIDIAVRNLGYTGVDDRRRLLFSSRLGYLVIDDRLTSSTIHSYRQLWHLEADANPAVSGSQVWTRIASGGNLQIRQLSGRPTIRLVKGQLSPIQGWLSYRLGHRVAAPVVEAVKRGSSVRYLTVLVPTALSGSSVRISSLRLSTSGFSFTIDVDGRIERVVASATDSTITALN